MNRIRRIDDSGGTKGGVYQLQTRGRGSRRMVVIPVLCGFLSSICIVCVRLFPKFGLIFAMLPFFFFLIFLYVMMVFLHSMKIYSVIVDGNNQRVFIIEKYPIVGYKLSERSISFEDIDGITMGPKENGLKEKLYTLSFVRDVRNSERIQGTTLMSRSEAMDLARELTNLLKKLIE